MDFVKNFCWVFRLTCCFNSMVWSFFCSLLLASSLIPLWSVKSFSTISVLLHLLRRVLWYRIWSISACSVDTWNDVYSDAAVNAGWMSVGCWSSGSVLPHPWWFPVKQFSVASLRCIFLLPSIYVIVSGEFLIYRTQLDLFFPAS